MNDLRLAYHKDDFGNDLLSRVVFSAEYHAEGKRPIVLIFHGGGLIVGSAAIIPAPQVNWLVERGFVCVIPNYRLAPQVTAKQSFQDCEKAYDWATTILSALLQKDHNVVIDPTRVVAMGHSSGGTLTLHIASQPSRPLRAVTVFYPVVYKSDVSGPCHQPHTLPPFGLVPDFEPSEQDWEEIKPAGRQLSEAPTPKPGMPMPPRSKWQMNIIKRGQWISTLQPDGDYAAIDPTSRISRHWPPTFVVAGEIDDSPGSGLVSQQRFVSELKSAGLAEVGIEVVPNAWHMFDLAPDVGTTDVTGPRWLAVEKGLKWLRSHV